jgi:hypothetical protein
MKNKRFTFTLENSLKEKLVHDYLKSKFPSISAYLNELIKRGLPTSEPLDLWMKLIDKKIDCLTDNVTAFHTRNFTLLEKIFKRIHIVYRVVGYALARLFYLKSGPVSPDDIEDANVIIKREVAEIERNYRE